MGPPQSSIAHSVKRAKQVFGLPLARLEANWLAANFITEPELHHLGAVSAWLRWVAFSVSMVLILYLPDIDLADYVLYAGVIAVLAVPNAILHHRAHTARKVSVYWLLALCLVDVAVATGLQLIAADLNNHIVFLAYFPALSGFAVIFGSLKLNIAMVTLVAGSYAIFSLSIAESFGDGDSDGFFLFTRIALMFILVVMVSNYARIDRMRRQEAVARERALYQEQIKLAKTIHDSTAQSAYMIGLGLESALELAPESCGELVSKLEATNRLNKSAMWDLRYPIDIALVVEGRGLGAVLDAHVGTFGAISSIPAEFFQTGEERPLPSEARRMLFTIAHNALTNAFRHAQASRITVALDYRSEGVRMSVCDDGIGLPANYATRGHGFTNMQADAARIGGKLAAGPGPDGKGTCVACTVTYEPAHLGHGSTS